jgi:hypothetical protein
LSYRKQLFDEIVQVFSGVQHFHRSLFSGMSIAVKGVVLLIVIPLDAIVLLGINLIIKNCQFLSFYGAETSFFVLKHFEKSLASPYKYLSSSTIFHPSFDLA